MTGREKFLSKLKPYLLPRDLENIETAYMFSKYGHRTQYRDGGKVRYFDHPRAVALILTDEQADFIVHTEKKQPWSL